MKKIIFILFLLLLPSITKSNDKFYIGLDYSKQLISKYRMNTDVYSINIQFFITNSISLNYSYSYGISPNGTFYKIPLTSDWGYNLYEFANSLVDDDDDDDSPADFIRIPAVLMFLIPEGISYHTDLSEYLSIEFALNPLQYYYFEYDDYLKPSAGLKFHYHIDKLIITPHIETILGYSPYLSLGISIGYKL